LKILFNTLSKYFFQFLIFQKQAKKEGKSFCCLDKAKGLLNQLKDHFGYIGLS